MQYEMNQEDVTFMTEKSPKPNKSDLQNTKIPRIN